MLSILLIWVPLFFGCVVFFIQKNFLRRLILVIASSLHLILTLTLAFSGRGASGLNGWIHFDAPGILFVCISSFLFWIASLYVLNYLKRESRQNNRNHSNAHNRIEAVFTSCLLLFLSTITLVTASQNLGLLWIALEATTLATAPLIYFHKTAHSLEATWKYLLICSVGIGLALLGNLFVSISFPTSSGPNLNLGNLIQHACALNPQWLKAAFIFFFIGYGTKMGLAPMHTWLPDAHSEAPSVVSALLSGILLNCGFLSVLRVYQIMLAANLGPFGRELFIVFGLLSIFTAAVFIVAQSDYKRMLAYSSVENMGIMLLGVGLGGSAVFGAMIHTINHSLTKGLLFMTAGNIFYFYRSRSVNDVSGLLKTVPVTGILWIAGFLAITGTPPFGLFISEFIIIKQAVFYGNVLIPVILIALLAIIFIGMASVFLKSALGEAPAGIKESAGKEKVLSFFSPAVLCAITLTLGIYLPSWLEKFLNIVAANFMQ